MLQATWGERPPQGGVDRVVFQPTPEPELLASVMGGHSLLLWSLQGVQEEPEPFALVPAHAQLLTCCDFDAAGTRLLCGDAAGQVFLYTVPPGAPSSSSLLHRCAVDALCAFAPVHPSAPPPPRHPASARHLGPAPPPPAPPSPLPP